MKKKTILSLAAALLLSLGLSTASFAEETVVAEEAIEITAEEESDVLYASDQWRQNSKGWWYSFADGSYACDGYYIIGGKTYCFNKSGYMVTGWVQNGSDWMYFTPSGAMCNPGWMKINNKWYYFEIHGDGYLGNRVILNRKTVSGGIVSIGTKEYYFSPGGALTTGWVNLGGGIWRYYTDNGSASGWQKINDKWYFFSYNTHNMVTDSLITDGATGYTYRVGSNGAMVVGWYLDEYGNYYYYDVDGHEVSGWKKVGTKWYYFHPEFNNVMVSDGVLWINGNFYEFAASGAMRTNCFCSNMDAFPLYFGSNGAAVRGWVKVNNKWYYGNPYYDAFLVDGLMWIDGDSYYFDENYVMQTGWVYIENDTYFPWHYYSSNGKGYTGWMVAGENYYYVQDSAMYTDGIYHIESEDCCALFNSDGVFICYMMCNHD